MMPYRRWKLALITIIVTLAYCAAVWAILRLTVGPMDVRTRPAARDGGEER